MDDAYFKPQPKPKQPSCPEHGAVLCYGQFGNVRLYRCTLGFCQMNSDNKRYLEKTHREFLVFEDGTIKEVEPNKRLSEEKTLEDKAEG